LFARDRFGIGTGRTAEVTMSDPDLYTQVIDVVGRVLQVQAVNPMADFFDLGADSVAVLQIIELVGDECGVSVSVTDAFDAPDIDSFARLVAEERPIAPQPAD
jgi:acyl carrier protein